MITLTKFKISIFAILLLFLGGITGGRVTHLMDKKTEFSNRMINSLFQSKFLIDQIDHLDHGEIKDAKGEMENTLNVYVSLFNQSAKRDDQIGEIARRGLQQISLHRSGVTPASERPDNAPSKAPEASR